MAEILGKKIVGRFETLHYANSKFGWPYNYIIGISAWYGFWAWLWTKWRNFAWWHGWKSVYYCIDFYSSEIAKNPWDRIFIWAAMQMDKFLIKHCDEVWDISKKIDEGRVCCGHYLPPKSKIVPLSYPPSYFRFCENVNRDTIAYVGLMPYGMELYKKIGGFVWLKNLPLEKLLFELSICGIGISLWKDKGNNYYGDPGKTKLYSACGLPVIMTGNTPYAKIIHDTNAGLTIVYNESSLRWAIKEILDHYDYYKSNVKKTWKYINADEVFKDLPILEQ